MLSSKSPVRAILSLALGVAALGACDKGAPGASDGAPDSASPPVPEAQLQGVEAFPPPDQLIRTIESLPLASDPAKAANGAPTAATEPAAVGLVPVGPEGRPTGFEIGFNQPMATFEGALPLGADSAISLRPEVAGTLRWTNGSTLAFRPASPLPLGTRFEVEVKAGLAAADGRKTAAPAALAFETERLAVTWAPYGTATYPAGREPTDALEIELNQPVSLETAQQLVEVTRVPTLAALATGPWSPVTFEVRALPQADDGTARQGFAVVPSGGFAIGSYFRVRIPTTLTGAGPLGLAQPYDLFARGPELLAVNYASCGDSTCTPDASWSVGFNNPLVAESVAGCLSVSPAATLEDLAVNDRYVTFRLKGVKIGDKRTLRVATSCVDTYGSHPGAPYALEVAIEQAPPRLRMTEGAGYLEPAAPGERLSIPVGASNTAALSLRRLRITRDTLGAFLPKALSEWGSLELANVEGGQTTTLAKKTPSELTTLPVDLDDVLGPERRGLVFVEVTTPEDPDAPVPAGETRPLSARRALVHVTDTGLTVKTSPQNTLLWTASLGTAAPIAGAEVWLVDAAGRTLWTGRTDESGLAMGPGPSSLPAPPRVAVASQGGDDLTFVDLEDWSMRFAPYRFNLPFAWDAVADQVSAFLFTERGVYRAGEKVYLKGYMRVDRGRKLELLPTPRVNVEVVNALGVPVLTQEVTLGALGEFDFAFDLPANAPLGAWSVRARPQEADKVNGEGSGSFRVEAYRANRFEVKVGEARREGSAVKAHVSGRYLYGAPMMAAKVEWTANQAADAFTAAGFEGFSFATAYDGWWWEPTEESTSTIASGEGVLGDDGGFDVVAELGELDLSKGPALLTLEARVTDVDEQVVAGRTRLRLDPADFYVGVRHGGALAKAGEPFKAATVVVSPDGKAVGDVKVEVAFKKRTWESVKKVAAGGGTTWTSEQRDEPVALTQVPSLASGPVDSEFTAPTAGLYVIEASATDASGRVSRASELVWVWGDGEAWWARNDDERLNVVAEKERYAVGDVARFLVQSPYPRAQALVTVERSGVISQRVIAVEGGAPLLEVPVTEDMQPNAYVSIALIRGRVEAAEGDPEGGRPASKIGYATLKVELGDKALKVAVAPERTSYRPGETVKATLSLADAEGRPVAGQIAFFAVDEGVLQLTGYATPNPLGVFYKDRPIAVYTSDSRTRLWSRLEPTDDGMKSDWGGGGDEGGATRYRSEFATTAVFLPKVEVGPSGQAEVAFTLPENLGAFRLMAVAAAEGNRFGRADTRVEVKKPLIVQPGLPRFLSSGDTFDARVVVQALEEQGAGEVQVALATSGAVEVLEASTLTTTLSLGRAEAVTFKARALEPGPATFAFKVTRSGDAQAADAVQIELPVQYPASVRTAITTGKVGSEHGVANLAARKVTVPDWTREDVGGLEIELAASALGELLPGLRYLIEYPYGCVEQTTGATLPLLALATMGERFSLPGVDAKQVFVRAQAGIDRLQTMQLASGGLAYWPGASDPHPWGSAYGGLALVRASKTPGLQVPPAALDGLRTFLQSLLAGTIAVNTPEWAREMHPVEPFAAWVLALAGAPDAAAHSRLFEKRSTLPVFGKALLAMAVAEAKGDTGMVDALVGELTTALRIDGDRAVLVQKPSTYYYATMDSDVRTAALVLMALMRTRPSDALIDPLARGLLAERQGGRWMSTQDNGFAILALAEYFQAREKPGQSYLATVRLDGEILLSERLESATLAAKRVSIPMRALRAANGKLLTITREGDDAPLFYTLRFDYAPAEVPMIPIARGFGLDREYVYAEGDRAGQRVTTLAAGDLVRVNLRITTPDARRYVALDDPFPAGLEPVNTGFDTTAEAPAGAEQTSWIFTHAEQKDDRVSIFADAMPAGTWSHSYLARATTKGTFLAPAARVHEMYAPDIFGQAAAIPFTVE